MKFGHLFTALLAVLVAFLGTVSADTKIVTYQASVAADPPLTNQSISTINFAISKQPGMTSNSVTVGSTNVIVLSTPVAVTVSFVDGGNKYHFNGVYDATKPFGVSATSYTFTGVTSTHPIGFRFDSDNVFTVDFTGGTRVDADPTSVNFVEAIQYYYHGTFTLTITGTFNVGSYHCKNHGYMGGEDHLTFMSTSSV